MAERFQTVDKAQLARRFGAAARHYDAHVRRCWNGCRAGRLALI
jgi:hypothetical protein